VGDFGVVSRKNAFPQNSIVIFSAQNEKAEIETNLDRKTTAR
jgi:hypothetical protein